MKYKSNSGSLTFSFRLFDIIEFSDLRQPFLALKSYFFKSLFQFVFWAHHWPLFKRANLTFTIWKIRFWPSIGLWAALLELVFDLAFMTYVGIFKLRSPKIIYLARISSIPISKRNFPFQFTVIFIFQEAFQIIWITSCNSRTNY